MDRDELLRQWLEEERAAHIHGWDFSHIKGRYDTDDPPWDYREIVEKHLSPKKKVLDIDTGGGEFLLSLGHPCHNLAATENYPPNVKLCEEKLLPLGVDFHRADGSGPLPFSDESFDLVLDRHGDWNAAEICRVLRPGGIFVTEQVGAENDRELTELVLGKTVPSPFLSQHLHIMRSAFDQVGFSVLRQDEAFRPIRFLDVGALVWFAHIIEWEFPNFDVKTHLNNLYQAQSILEAHGVIEGWTHRFLLVAQK